MIRRIQASAARKVILKVWDKYPNPIAYEGTSLDEVLMQAIADSPDTKLYPWQFELKRGSELHVTAIACSTEEEYSQFKREVILEHIMAIRHGV